MQAASPFLKASKNQPVESKPVDSKPMESKPTRRGLLAGFGQALGASFALSQLAVAQAPLPVQIAAPSVRLLQRFWIAGFLHYQDASYLNSCATDAPLLLIAEPNNRYDARAVMVSHNGSKIGYVPRNDNAAFADLLSRSEVLSAKIVQINFTNIWQPLQIAVYF